MHRQTFKVTKGIVALVWGTVPATLEGGGFVDQKWKMALGNDGWLIVHRTA